MRAEDWESKERSPHCCERTMGCEEWARCRGSIALRVHRSHVYMLRLCVCVCVVLPHRRSRTRRRYKRALAGPTRYAARASVSVKIGNSR